MVSLGLVFVWFYGFLWVFFRRAGFAFLCSLESLFWWLFFFNIFILLKKKKENFE